VHFNPQIEQLVQTALLDTKQGRYEKALRGLDQVRKADWQYAGNQPEIQLAAGVCLSAMGRVEAAIGAFSSVVDLQPGNIVARLELARLHRKTGNDASAFVQLSKSLEIDPSNQRAVCQMIEHAMDQGDYEAAQRMIDPLVSLVTAGASNDPAVVILFARLARMVEREQEAFGLLERFDSSSNRSPGVRFSITRELAKCADKLGRHDEAIKFLEAAHAVIRTEFDADAHSSRVDELLQVWDAETVAGLPRSVPVAGEPMPVFVVGMPGSGTTLVERVIGVHPDAVACGSLPGLTRIATRLDPQNSGVRSLPIDPSKLTAELMQNSTASYSKMIGRVLSLLGNGLQPSVVTDKNSYNAFYLPMIASMFPECKIVHVVRGPQDTCLSHHMNLFGYDHPHSGDLYNLGRFYRDYARTVQHWRSMPEQLGVDFLEVSYEALVESPDAQSRRLVEFTGLEWDNVCASFFTARPAARTDCIDEVRRPMHTDSIGNHKGFEAHLGALEAGLSGATRPES
jgi:tetratricopeptide (TPR) repeat protein